MNRIRQIENALIYFLYWGCRVIVFPLLVFYFLYRCARDPRYLRHFPERLGGQPISSPATAPGGIWLHAVSVGEVISCAAALRELRELAPSLPLYVSMGTVAGREVAKEKLHGLADRVFYAPIDYAFAVRRVLRRIRPSVVVILETEIWPVLYREVKRAGSSLVIVNGRISTRAFPSYRRWRFFFRQVLEWPDAIFAQSKEDRERYIEIGASAEKVVALGNLKYDAVPAGSDPPRLIAEVLEKLRPATVWIAASTMPGADAADVDEDEAALGAFQHLAQSHPALLLILAPRKPERFDVVEQQLRGAGIRYQRRTQTPMDRDLTLPCVLLLDTIGELAGLFPLADVVFMGGSLARRGGHNLLEPAACGRAIITGPHLENFAAIGAEFRENYAMLEIGDASELAGAVEQLIADSKLRQDLGDGAAELAARHRGATHKAVAEILKWQDLAVPRIVPRAWSRPLLWFLSEVWMVATEAKRRRDTAWTRHLNTPVISIGGIGMGGAGKTPMVEYLAQRLRAAGADPAILTRGYRRRSIARRVVIQAGETVPVSLTGDEAWTLLRSGHAHLGIGADRCSTGRLLEEMHHPGVFLLDDGFQHWRLARDLDIVLIDALNPFAGGAVFPLGGLREPLSALGRADAFVITRTVDEREYRGIRNQLRAVNQRAPIFRAQVEPLYWVNARTHRPGHPPEGPLAAFCGLANPASFWGTLKGLRIEPVFTWAFDDHHGYQWTELQRLAQQARMQSASVLLTTEKDVANLPERAAEILLDALVELYWLKIGIQVDDEAGLLRLIESKLGKVDTHNRQRA
jgi:3-deoxy-D-manno-octulosonic-acid transferase